MTYRVEKAGAWDVAAPGGRRWSGAPSQPAAFQLAQSLAAIDTMLRQLAQPVAVPAPRRAPRYGCYRLSTKASS